MLGEPGRLRAPADDVARARLTVLCIRRDERCSHLRESSSWRWSFIQAYLERSIRELGISLPAAMLLRCWTTHMHGSVWNAADPARSLGLSMPTIRRYLDLFTDLYLVRQLQPWHENVAKRQVMAPKVYLRDSGLLHALLGLATERDLLSHPKVGASWEGYVLEEVLRGVQPEAAHFWAAIPAPSWTSSCSRAAGATEWRSNSRMPRASRRP